MDTLKQLAIDQLRYARQCLLDISKDNLSGQSIIEWFQVNLNAIRRAETMNGGYLLEVNIQHFMQGSWQETDPDVCIVLRTKLVELLDQSIKGIDSQQVVRPVLDELILKVKDPKLATLLLEFNEARTTQPNLASGGFRTILSLIIRERAKLVAPNSDLALRGDISFERDIKEAVAYKKLFNSAEQKMLTRHLQGGDKDSFDNVVHKPDFLIDKAGLEDAVDLLNHLLPAII